jgi:general secretion pathway protein N
MRRWRWWATAVAVYLVLLLVLAPATLLDAALGEASGGRLRLAAVRGTLWTGSGQLTLVDNARKTAVSQPLGWRIMPATLLRGYLAGELQFDGSRSPLVVMVYADRIELAPAEFSLPAAWLGAVLPKLAGLGFGGELQARLGGLVIRAGSVRGNAMVRWRAASSLHAPVSPLGDYELVVTDGANAVSARLRTLDGPLRLEGGGNWAVGARPAFAASARIASPQQEQLTPFLRMIAVERGSGNFELQLN